MIFRKLKREFPQFANLQANKVSDLTYRQKVQIAKAIWHNHTMVGENNVPKIIEVRAILTSDDYPWFTYQSMDTNTLSRKLYKALKTYYNE